MVSVPALASAASRKTRVLASTTFRRDRTAWALLLLVALTALVYLGSAGMPALLDDTDSLYAEVAREMNLRGDWITPHANGIRYFEKPPLFYWLISLSYAAFGDANAFTARLPTALAVIALVLVTFDIGRLLYGQRTGLLGALALATSAGLFLFTRIVLPDVLLTLLLALFFDAFVRWERAARKTAPLLAMYAASAGAVLTKGLIGIVFPAAAVLLALAVTGRLRSLRALVSLPGIALFLAIAAPWHLLVGFRNPGFFWFYFVNEHVLRFLGLRQPMDYGTVPLIPFWLLHLVWLFPWSIYLVALARPSALRRAIAAHGAALGVPFAWAASVLVFFSLSTRLEYYTFPALPALALLAGVQATACWERGEKWPGRALAVLGAVCGTVLVAVAGLDPAVLAERLLAFRADPDLYVFYFGHLFDLTADDLDTLRVPLLAAGLALGLTLPLHHLLNRPLAKAAALAVGMAVLFGAANLAFQAFAPHLTSKPLADEIGRRLDAQAFVVVHGDYEDMSSIGFYVRRALLLHGGHSVNLDYGARFPGAAPLVVDDATLNLMWSSTPPRLFLVVPETKQAHFTGIIQRPVYVIAKRCGKVLLSNLPDEPPTAGPVALPR